VSVIKTTGIDPKQMWHVLISSGTRETSWLPVASSKQFNTQSHRAFHQTKFNRYCVDKLHIPHIIRNDSFKRSIMVMTLLHWKIIYINSMHSVINNTPSIRSTTTDKLMWHQVVLLRSGGSDPTKSPLPICGRGPLSNTMQPVLGTTWVSLPNGITFCLTVLAGCMSVTDGQWVSRV